MEGFLFENCSQVQQIIFVRLVNISLVRVFCLGRGTKLYFRDLISKEIILRGKKNVQLIWI